MAQLLILPRPAPLIDAH